LNFAIAGAPINPRLHPGSPISNQGSYPMKTKNGTQDQVEGKIHEAKGKVKEIAGQLTDNPKLEAEGVGEKVAGKVQKKIGEIKKVLGK
jgi:uncharacterized protein YjbJ (UPF0337 family)